MVGKAGYAAESTGGRLKFNSYIIVPRKKVKKVSEAGFIPGIYNYCDRWCEKCQQRLRCMSYVMGKKLEERGGFEPERQEAQEDENIWTRLKSVFESTYEVLHELADERGIDVEDIYVSENINKEFWGEEYEGRLKGLKEILLIGESDIIRICMIYEFLADKCLEKVFELLDDREGKMEPIDEALEVVGWYLDLIQAKMRRALCAYYYHSEKEEEHTEDYNGSAKVALISIDRSLENWRIVEKYCPHFKEDINHLVVVLEQLRSDIEAQFPTARGFLRPGFELQVQEK